MTNAKHDRIWFFRKRMRALRTAWSICRDTPVVRVMLGEDKMYLVLRSDIEEFRNTRIEFLATNGEVEHSVTLEDIYNLPNRGVQIG